MHVKKFEGKTLKEALGKIKLTKLGLMLLFCPQNILKILWAFLERAALR